MENVSQGTAIDDCAVKNLLTHSRN